MQEEIMTMAVDVLDIIFSNIAFDGMSSSRKMNIWNEFKSKVKGCAMQSQKLSVFVENICKKLNIQGIEHGYSAIIDAEKHGNEILKLYRDELFMVIFNLRIKRDERKEKAGKKS